MGCKRGHRKKDDEDDAVLREGPGDSSSATASVVPVQNVSEEMEHPSQKPPGTTSSRPFFEPMGKRSW